MTRRLLLLNGLAVFGVLAHHASGYGFFALFYWTDRYLQVKVPNFELAGSLPFYGTVLIQQLDAFTLPAFMLVSGFFVAFTAKGENAVPKWHMVFSRLKYLVLPYFLWTSFFFLFQVRRAPVSIDEFLGKNYYILLLSQYYLLSPFILNWSRKNAKILLIIFVSFEVVREAVRILSVFEPPIRGVSQLNALMPKWMIPNLGLWFILGVIICLNRENISIWLRKMKWVLLFSTIMFGTITMFEYQFISNIAEKQWLGPYFGGLSRIFYTFFFLMSFFAFVDISFPYSNQVSWVGTKSLGIYLVHSVAMYYSAVMMYRIFPWILGKQLLYQTILIVVGLVVPLLLMELLGRSPARKYYRYIFG